MLLFREERVSAIDHVNSFGKINCHVQSEGQTDLMKALGYFMCKKLEGGYGGLVGMKAMLVG